MSNNGKRISRRREADSSPSTSFKRKKNIDSVVSGEVRQDSSIPSTSKGFSNSTRRNNLAVLLESSSDDDENVRSSTTSVTNNSNKFLLHGSSHEVLHSESDASGSEASIHEPSHWESDKSSGSVTSEDSVDRIPDFLTRLVGDFLRTNMNHVQINAVLETLRTHPCHSTLPKDARTVLRTPRTPWQEKTRSS
ncbi:hypothetical protein HCN44_010233 [Aphidius gifuensis]|uniref:Uncharacterized protein n=1 Tax=Aphidius gifuensis TaxID=684658 RepID=A0A834XW79_APHGI|nr:hypothetical protein HCN44_010233 [Aphidius gifuensis]